MQSREKQYREALTAIQDEAVKLMSMSLPREAHDRISLIESICRHAHDVRSKGEKKRK